MSDALEPVEFHLTKEYVRWFSKLDRAARGRVRRKVDEYRAMGDVDVVASAGSIKPLGGGLLEQKMGGVRVYCSIEQGMMVLLNGGSKDTAKGQDEDIKNARRILADFRASRGVRGSAHGGRGRTRD